MKLLIVLLVLVGFGCIEKQTNILENEDMDILEDFKPHCINGWAINPNEIRLNCNTYIYLKEYLLNKCKVIPDSAVCFQEGDNTEIRCGIKDSTEVCEVCYNATCKLEKKK